ncbi:metallophosphoesterase family protein [Tuwongella immobilis]|uniref:PhoD-like phosphatase metallophosphatase domain-containing protein n=1 Tax=Tuwongella immobilis TaxID=692036 RepID=A0A6C2YPQ2_9BACT|nr:hypothetical protein [Tuwongella immobilis]VIP02862.1 Uncharacterized protein OS=Planctomyces limnophilus (strain ATCC 43296 / DSM 3776 / IFAM 1008 / 290) GN=Plim_3787 PE=4 SV=1 [Tuwongella immobilis]VTS02674.1 Uncharacterized protein OS=Planctomyces limnophilus (strain ATCC 43296 / DSM 3776 / IFAM 1008 / 290) GN=Plim_3787 PE=4 SV=1 [Tuwongella immobilis]
MNHESSPPPNRREFTVAVTGTILGLSGGNLVGTEPLESKPFGEKYANLDSFAAGEWWKRKPAKNNPTAPPNLNVPRSQVIAFALYTIDQHVLKLSAQLFPLYPDESRDVRLEFFRDGRWIEHSVSQIQYPGWSAHFRVEKWDDSLSVPYRVRHGKSAIFEGKIRKNPIDSARLLIANMSCNSSRTTGQRPEILSNLIKQDPDLLFFAGDQTYRHTEHTAGWIEFGLQFRDIIRDRPTITIPDDHDVGHPNLWGENGKQALRPDGADGGYFYPPEYVNLVQRQQTWHLPDPVDPEPIQRGIGVYFTRLRWGKIDFAILEDRKFKSGPLGKIPKMGPRPDHINDPKYDPKSIDLPGLELLGTRQESFLRKWSEDWVGSDFKMILSQTAFCGAVHMHGGPTDRLLADLDCNGWPQTPRNRALEIIRSVRATHLCGDQHLAVVVKHGVQKPSDGPFSFTSPALVNTIYGRWWHPENEKPGNNPVPNSPLPWTGEFKDGLGNQIRILAYANPIDIRDEKQRADGYGIAVINRKVSEITFECWPRFSDVTQPNQQFPGWPITISIQDNDGRSPVGWLPPIRVVNCDTPVIAVVSETSGELITCYRQLGKPMANAIFSLGKYTIRVGKDRPNQVVRTGMKSVAQPVSEAIEVTLMS